MIYPPELEVKETTDTASSASFLDLYLECDDSGQISTKIYDKRDDFNFKIINFPNMCSNIPASPAYGVYISQKFELNIIYFVCFDNSMKRVMQCTCVDFCDNIRSQDMYAKCPKIQSTYFVNRDICKYIGSIA